VAGGLFQTDGDGDAGIVGAVQGPLSEAFSVSWCGIEVWAEAVSTGGQPCDQNDLANDQVIGFFGVGHIGVVVTAMRSFTQA
jgi:hypothetical protein